MEMPPNHFAVSHHHATQLEVLKRSIIGVLYISQQPVDSLLLFRIELCYCLRHLRLLTEEELQDHLAESMVIQQIATEYGYDLALYQPGNEGVVIGDFGEKARLLYEQERISEGHYVELLNLLK